MPNLQYDIQIEGDEAAICDLASALKLKLSDGEWDCRYYAPRMAMFRFAKYEDAYYAHAVALFVFPFGNRLSVL